MRRVCSRTPGYDSRQALQLLECISHVECQRGEMRESGSLDPKGRALRRIVESLQARRQDVKHTKQKVDSSVLVQQME
jgi:hypothetical protein